MKAHRTDNVSLFFGLLFIVVAGGWMASEYLDVELPVAGWFIAGGLVIFGLLAIIGALIPQRKAVEETADNLAERNQRNKTDGPMLGE